MGKKFSFAGVSQIIIGLGILGIGGLLYFSGQGLCMDCFSSENDSALVQKQRNVKAYLDIQSLLPQHEIALRDLCTSLNDLETSVESVIRLKDYTVMNNKPFAVFGTSFSGLQNSIKGVQNSLVSVRNSLQNFDSKQNKEKLQTKSADIVHLKKDMAEVSARKEKIACAWFCILTLAILSGLGFVINGANICIRDRQTPAS